MQETLSSRERRGNDGLGSNSDIGAKLRAYYGAVQDQPIPDKFLDLLEKLDAVEQAGKRKGD
ncbi:MAG: NepR family anti-sigma factor [Devosia sp.]